jgi:hypothetical protein
MRRLLLLASAVAAFAACEQRFSATPPLLSSDGVAPGSASTNIDSLLAPLAADAGAAPADSSHAMVVTLCSASPGACSASDADATGGEAYHVVFGSGRGVMRSRGQAMADIYKELRDRTTSGERLAARPRAPGDGGASPSAGGAPPKPAASDDSDALAQSAQRLIDVVDGMGELTLDVAHDAASADCLVSLQRSWSSGVAVHCLIKAPERQHSHGRGGIGF